MLPPLAAGGVRAGRDGPARASSRPPGPDDPAAYTVDALAADRARRRRRARRAGAPGRPLVRRAGLPGRHDRRPAAVASLTLLDSGPAAIGGNRRERMAALEPLLAAGGLAGVYAGAGAARRRRPGMARRAAGVPGVPAPPLPGRLRGRAARDGRRAARRAGPDRTLLRAAGVPLLVAYGEARRRLAAGRRRRRWPSRLGAAHAVIAGAIHSPAAQQPAATVAAAAGLLGRGRRAGR